MATITHKRKPARRSRQQHDPNPNRRIAAQFVEDRWVRPNHVWHWTIGENGGEYVFWLRDNHWEALRAYVHQLGFQAAKSIVASTQNRHHYAATHCMSRLDRGRRANVFDRAAALLAAEIALLVRKPA